MTTFLPITGWSPKVVTGWVPKVFSEDQPRDDHGRWTSGGGGGSQRITADEARGNSRAVSAAEFDRIAAEGRTRLDALKGASSPPAGLDDHFAELTRQAYAECQKPWGGMTIDAHTGQPVQSNADVYALTVREPGQEPVSIPENASPEMFAKAMGEARARFADQLSWSQGHLGVFHDDDKHAIDIDPSLVVTSLADVESIGAATHAVGGAYNFGDGNGYFPPHVADTKAKSYARQADPGPVLRTVPGPGPPTVDGGGSGPDGRGAGEGQGREGRLAAALRAALKDFDPALHPRDERGRFGSGGGSDKPTGDGRRVAAAVTPLVPLDGGVSHAKEIEQTNRVLTSRHEAGAAPSAPVANQAEVATKLDVNGRLTGALMDRLPTDPELSKWADGEVQRLSGNGVEYHDPRTGLNLGEGLAGAWGATVGVDTAASTAAFVDARTAFDANIAKWGEGSGLTQPMGGWGRAGDMVSGMQADVADGLAVYSDPQTFNDQLFSDAARATGQVQQTTAADLVPGAFLTSRPDGPSFGGAWITDVDHLPDGRLQVHTGGATDLGRIYDPTDTAVYVVTPDGAQKVMAGVREADPPTRPTQGDYRVYNQPMPTDPREVAMAYRVRQGVDTWANSAGDSDPESIALQMAAGEHFGLGPDATASLRAYASGNQPPGMDLEQRSFGDVFQGQPGNPATWSSAAVADRLLGRDATFYDRFVGATYDETQKELAAQGIDKLVLSRGAYFVPDQAPDWARPPVTGVDLGQPTGPLERVTASDLQPGDHVMVPGTGSPSEVKSVLQQPDGKLNISTPDGAFNAAPDMAVSRVGAATMLTLDLHPQVRDVSANPLTSWTSSTKTAQAFSSFGNPNEKGLTIQAVVPASRVWSLSSSTGPGCLGEREAIIIGGDMGKAQVSWVASAWGGGDKANPFTGHVSTDNLASWERYMTAEAKAEVAAAKVPATPVTKAAPANNIDADPIQADWIKFGNADTTMTGEAITGHLAAHPAPHRPAHKSIGEALVEALAVPAQVSRARDTAIPTLTRAQVHYRVAAAGGTGAQRCGTCVMFLPAEGACTLVMGTIAAGATCDRWSPAQVTTGTKAAGDDEARDDHGRWTSGGGTGLDETHAALVGDLGALSPENQRAVHEQVAKVPSDVAKILADRGVKVVGMPEVVSGPRGRLDYGGMYDPDKREVQVSNKGFNDDKITTQQGNAPMVLHELGHATDHAFGWVSRLPAFKVLWKEAAPRKGSYWQKPLGGTNPRTEMLAEAYAHTWAGTRPDPTEHFTLTPRLQQVVNELRADPRTHAFTVSGDSKAAATDAIDGFECMYHYGYKPPSGAGDHRSPAQTTGATTMVGMGKSSKLSAPHKSPLEHKVHDALRKHYSEDSTEWACRSAWERNDVPLDRIAFGKRPGGMDPAKVTKFAKKWSKGKKMKRVVVIDPGGGQKMTVADGYHRLKGAAEAGVTSVRAYVGTPRVGAGNWRADVKQMQLTTTNAAGPEDASTK